jgi:hypothetical protein
MPPTLHIALLQQTYNHYYTFSLASRHPPPPFSGLATSLDIFHLPRKKSQRLRMLRLASLGAMQNLFYTGPEQKGMDWGRGTYFF